jgi:aldehyde dehydrogenase (NAD+)
VRVTSTVSNPPPDQRRLQTRDIARVHRIAPLLQAGTISVNGTSGLPPGAPFGGYNQSGYGREGLFEFLRTKNVFIRS